VVSFSRSRIGGRAAGLLPRERGSGLPPAQSYRERSIPRLLQRRTLGGAARIEILPRHRAFDPHGAAPPSVRALRRPGGKADGAGRLSRAAGTLPARSAEPLERASRAQPIFWPADRSCWEASTIRSAIPASAALPQARGS